jgi:glutathione synthase/RimK-type ligase-like ATP-grasp enzyme
MAKFAFYKNENKIYKLDAELPPSEEYVIFDLDTASPDDIIFDNGQIRLKTEVKQFEEEKQTKLAELNNYVAGLLEKTDYIIVRIAEAEALGDTNIAEKLKQKYPKQLQQQQVIREWNEQMKQAIRNAKTLEELKAIEIRYV